MALSLAGKTAIVTGAGSGINLAFARLLLGKQCNVIFADLALRPEAQALVSAHQTASHQSPARAVFQKTDVRDWLQLEQMFHVADREFGGAEIVCPGAGVYEPPWSSFFHPPGTPPSTDPIPSSRYALLDINLTHPIRTTQLALAHFLNPTSSAKPAVSASSPRHILHLSSIAAQTSPLPAPIYNASKHAITGFVRSLAPLDALGVRVTAVAPGVVQTPLWTEHAEKLDWIGRKDEWVRPEFVAEVMGRLLQQEEVEVRVSSPGKEEGRELRVQMEKVKVEGGLILEVALGRVRLVRRFGDWGPEGEGTTVAGMGRVVAEVLGSLREGWGR